MNKDRRRLLLADVRARLAAGETDAQIQTEMELRAVDYAEILEDLYRQDATQRFDKPTERVFTDYCLRQEACIRDLNILIRHYKKRKNDSAAIGAIRAKSEILDRMIQRGQEFGVLTRAPEQHQVIAGVAIKDATDAELRGKVVEQLEAVKALMVRFGEVDILEATEAPILAPHVPEKPIDEKGEVKDGRPGFARGGTLKRKGSRVVAMKRIKQKQPPPG